MKAVSKLGFFSSNNLIMFSNILIAIFYYSFFFIYLFIFFKDYERGAWVSKEWEEVQREI